MTNFDSELPDLISSLEQSNATMPIVKDVGDGIYQYLYYFYTLLYYSHINK